jgi:glycosyltransferase involved in cell wall biosynthesis
MRILFANHTSAWSGAEVSLMRLIAGLGDGHEICVACPDAGPLVAALDDARVERVSLPQVDASLRVHPVQTPVGLGQLAAAGVALARAARRFRADVVHTNTVRTGITGAIARRLGGPPFIVRAHEHIPLTRVGRPVRSLLVRTAAGVVAVSDYTAHRLNEGLARPVATRVYNSIDHGRFNARVAPAAIREELGIAQSSALLGQVAQITPWKRQDTSIRALAEVRARGHDAHLLLVGQVAFGGKHVRYDNHEFLRSLERLVEDLRVRNAVHLLGQRGDVPSLLRALDVCLLPSLEEPFGLVTVESMAVGTPPLVSAVGAGPELVADGVTGRVLPSERPDRWADAADELLRDPERLSELGGRGPAAASPFNDGVHAAQMLEVYERVLASGRAAPEEDALVTPGPQPHERTGVPWLS